MKLPVIFSELKNASLLERLWACARPGWNLGVLGSDAVGFGWVFVYEAVNAIPLPLLTEPDVAAPAPGTLHPGGVVKHILTIKADARRGGHQGGRTLGGDQSLKGAGLAGKDLVRASGCPKGERAGGDGGNLLAARHAQRAISAMTSTAVGPSIRIDWTP